MISYELLQPGGETEVNRLYNAVYGANRTREQFAWEFQQGPAGGAIYVIAKDTDTGRIVGTQCAIPLQLVTHDGHRILSAKSEDTLVDPAYRGKQIFEKMYELLFAECRKAGIRYLWGFTYAIKPFLKISFEAPFQTNMGVLCLNTGKSFRYLSSLNPANSSWARIKVLSLVVLSRISSLRMKGTVSLPPEYSFREEGVQDLNDLAGQQLGREGLFSLVQDQAFLDWRINANPYPHEYFSYCLKGKDGLMAAHCFVSVDRDGVCYVAQQLFVPQLPVTIRRAFIMLVLGKVRPRAFIIRCWGFETNPIGRMDVKLFKEAGFTFINRGISFVWKALSPGPGLDPRAMLLSRMAAQGT